MNEETNAPTGYGKYVDECLNEAAKHFFSEGEDKYSVADLFYAGVRCGKSWSEKQGSKPQGKSALEAIHEQKPNNKPKFNVDNWICNSACIVHIASIKDGMYYFDEGDGLDITFVDNNYHLWSIADAKDGDVLVSDDDERPFIFKGCLDPNHPNCPVAYCGIDTEDMFLIGNNCWWNDGEVQPATKEQRDQLEKAMADAGWEFDFDKKELKKIVQQTSAWSEGDDAYKLFAISAVEDYYDEKNPLHKDIVDWLESLKQGVTWRPSNKQIRALRWVLNNIPYNTHKEEISGLLDQIKDL